MYHRIASSLRLLLMFTALCLSPAWATLQTLDLTCVLNGLEDGPCANAGLFGTITLEDGIVGHDGEVKVTVDLAGTGEKFRDLMLNVVPGFTTITSLDGQASLAYNGYSMTPYTGLFDLGQNDAQGWEGNDGYMTFLSANAPLSVAQLLQLDSGGKIYAALHIQNIGPNGCEGLTPGSTNCVPGTTGTGSLKIGATLSDGGVGPEESVPEPSTVSLMIGGLAALWWVKRRRTAAARA